MKRILIYGLSNRYGGLETIILNILKHIDKTQYKLDFILGSNHQCEFENEIVSNRGKIYKVTPWGKNPIKHRSELKKILLSSDGYDFVWVNTASATNISMQVITKKYTKSKIIVHCHGVSFEVQNKIKYLIVKLLHKINHKKLLVLTDYPFACSNKAADWLFGRKVFDEKCGKIINNAIEAERYLFNIEKRNKYRKKYLLNDRFVICHVGRMSKVKNHIFLIDIFKEINKENKNSILMLIGDGDMEDAVKKRVDDYGMSEKVLFMGARNDVPELLQAADVLVLPSISEGFGLVVIEAQAAGLQCIVSKAVPKEAKITELVEYFSITKSAEFWAKEIVKYQKGYKRMNTYNEIVARGFDINETVNEIEKLLGEGNKNEIN